MPAPGFTHIQWKTLQKGTQAYLDSLALHHTEVTEFVLAGGYQVQGKSHERKGEQYLQYITKLLEEAQEIPIAGATTPARVTFVRARAPKV